MEQKIDYKKIEEERRREHLKNPIPEGLEENNTNKDKLKIAYLLKWTVTNGGTKVIFQYSNKLAERGHKIYLICHDEEPTWFPLDKNVEYIHVPDDKLLSEAIPKDVDLIVCATNICIYEAIEQKIAPVIYFEQGSHHLFNRKEIEQDKLDFIAKEIEVCNNIYTVSEYAKEKIFEYYQKDSYVIPNAVDREVFYYGDDRKNNEKVIISSIGPEDWEFKGMKYILEAIKILEKEFDIEFQWVTPRDPITKIGKIFVNPEQSVIGNMLRKTDIFILASEFESFCLPILEAMTCGAAVVCTNAGGNMEFSKDRETCLLVNKRDTNDIVEKVKELILNRTLREQIAQNGVDISKKYDYEKNCDKLEEYYKSIAKYSVKK